MKYIAFIFFMAIGTGLFAQVKLNTSNPKAYLAQLQEELELDDKQYEKVSAVEMDYRSEMDRIVKQEKDPSTRNEAMKSNIQKRDEGMKLALTDKQYEKYLMLVKASKLEKRSEAAEELKQARQILKEKEDAKQ
jgi:hypothetical protein